MSSMLQIFVNIIAVLGLLVVAWIITASIHALRNPLSKVPGPWYAKYTNLRLKLAVLTGNRIHYVQSLHEIYGPYVRVSPEEVAVNHPKGFAQIHAYKAGFEKAEWYKIAILSPRPVLVAMQNAHDHGRRRKLFARGFSKSNIRQNWEPVLRQKVELAVSKIQIEATKTGVVDVMKWWTLMASDASAHLMFGESFNTLEVGDTNEFLNTLTNATKGGGIGAELPLVRFIGERLPFQSMKELFRTNEFVMNYAKIAIRNMRSSQGSKNIFANILAESEKGETLDDEDIEAEAIGLIIAGTDTTAVSLTYLTWAVLSRPDLRRELEAEVATLPEGYQDADAEELPLLNAVIEEAMRLYGAAPGALPRVVPPGGIDMADGYYIPGGTIVSTQAFSTHRDPTLFPSPYEFKPDRWMPGRQSRYAVTHEARRVFAAFGAGARSCLGIHIAYSELRLATAEFFRRFPGSCLAPSTTPKSMEMENFFLIAPRAHRCEIIVGRQ